MRQNKVGDQSQLGQNYQCTAHDDPFRYSGGRFICLRKKWLNFNVFESIDGRWIAKRCSNANAHSEIGGGRKRLCQVAGIDEDRRLFGRYFKCDGRGVVEA